MSTDASATQAAETRSAEATAAETQAAQAVRNEQAATAESAAPAANTTQEGAPEGQEGAQGEPEKTAAPAIEVKLPDGVEPDPKLMEALQGAAKDSASAQALVDAFVEYQAAAEAKVKAQWEATQKAWADQLRADPDMGGARYDASVAAAEKAMLRFADADLRQLLQDTGLRNHPSMFRLMVRVGQALSEDRAIGLQGGPTTQRTEADRLRAHYPSMTMKEN